MWLRNKIDSRYGYNNTAVITYISNDYCRSANKRPVT